jgi:nucleoside 2-deoxyribosyltransferase
MILRGLLERSLGGFICIRGYAKLSDLAKLSQSNSYQREIDQKHLEELEAYLDKREYVFFPEVTLSYTLNSKQDNISISPSNELLNLSSPKGKVLGIKQFNKSYASGTDLRNKEQIRVVTLEIDDRRGLGLFQRIDGNHRLKASEKLDASKTDIQTPFCLILLNDNDAEAKQQSVIFHNINTKGLALTFEENLSAILGTDRFTDNELVANFGWTYLKAKKLSPEIDKDYLSSLGHLFDKGLFTVLIRALTFLADQQLIAEADSTKSIKKKLTVINTAYNQEPRLQACNEIGLLIAFLYYAYQSSNDDLVLISAFKSWVLRNHIDDIKEVDAGSLIDVFNKVHGSKINIFMAMPYYSDQEVDSYNKALGKAVESIKQANPCLNLIHHSIMRNHSPTHDMIADILNKIQSCDIFIADITDNNANVLYEYGYARGKNKPCVLLRKKSSAAQLPVKSDYANDLRFEFEGDYALESQLKTEIESVLSHLNVGIQ